MPRVASRPQCLTLNVYSRRPCLTICIRALARANYLHNVSFGGLTIMNAYLRVELIVFDAHSRTCLDPRHKHIHIFLYMPSSRVQSYRHTFTLHATQCRISTRSYLVRQLPCHITSCLLYTCEHNVCITHCLLSRLHALPSHMVYSRATHI